MKQLLILYSVLLVLLVSCKKDDILPLPEYWKGPQAYGWGKCMRNGVLWETSTEFIYTNVKDSSVCLFLQTFASDTVHVEELGLVRIPLKVGTHQVFPLGAGPTILSTDGVFWIGYYDEYDAVWQVNKKKYSSITIDNYDPVTKTLTGKFDLYFSTEWDLNYSDQITFETGTFEAKITR